MQKGRGAVRLSEGLLRTATGIAALALSNTTALAGSSTAPPAAVSANGPAGSTLDLNAPIDRTQGVRSPQPQLLDGSGLWAVVTTTAGDLYDGHDNAYFLFGHGRLKPIGHYRAGQHFCLIDTSPHGLALIQTRPATPPQYSSEDAYIRNKGELQPDTAPNNCNDVAVWASQYNPTHKNEVNPYFRPPGAVVASAEQPHPMTLAEALWYVICATVSLSLINYLFLRAATSPENRLRLWEKQKHNHVFNKNTGAWQRITSRGWHGRVIVSTDSRSKRLIAEHSLVNILTYFAVPVLSFIGSAFFVGAIVDAGTNHPNGAHGIAYICVFMGTLSVLPVMTILLTVGNWLVVDPPPELPEMRPFGDASPVAPANHPGAPDLSYKPNA